MQKSKQCSCRIHSNPTKPICTAHRQNDHPTTRLLELLWAAKNIILKNLFETLTITSVGMYCFYLSLSASYMANIPSSCGMFVNRALALKVSINAFPGGTPCWLIFLFLFFCILYVWMMLYCKVFDMMINNLAWIFQNTPTSTNNCPNWWHRLMFLVDLKLQKKLGCILTIGAHGIQFRFCYYFTVKSWL